MKVLLLGGTGMFGRQTAALLANENLITEIGIASRKLENAQGAIGELGEKAHAVCVDINDLSQLSAIAANYDIMVNAAGPMSEVQVPAIQAAIEAGVHYTDLGALGKYAQAALQMDAQARGRGITAIICSGWIAVNNLMAVHAFRQLDQTERLSAVFLFDYSPGGYFSPDQSLIRTRETGKVETSWDLIDTAGGPILSYEDGHWKRLDPLEKPGEIIHPSGCMVTAYLTDSPSIFTLPSYLPGVKTINCLLGMVPPQLMELFIQKSQRITRGETDWTGAAMDFFETAMADQERWLVSPAGYPGDWWMWAVAEGQKDGRKARYMCWPAMILNWTTIPFVITTLRILRGEISQYGVLPSEACFELGSFLDEASKYLAGEDQGKPLLNDRFDWLE